MVTKDDGFESIFNKAKNTTNRFQDWEFVMSFCNRVTEEPEGPLGAIKVLVDKLRVEDEDTQMLALAILEACVKNCGAKFHNEVGKFKLLNELIKIISPKYNGDTSSDQLKEKVRGLFFQWRRGLPKQGKILDAYEMLKKEGLIDDDGNLPDGPPPPALEETPRDSIIKDEKEIETLEKLLKSKNPQDLVRANEMIQERYKHENTKLEKLQHRSRELDLVDNNAKLLEELLGHFSVNSSQPEVDLVEELKKSCVTMREKLQKIAEQCTDDDALLNKLCTSSDRLVKVLEKYDTVMASVQPKPIASKDIPALISSPPSIQPQINSSELILDSLIDLDLGYTGPTTTIPFLTQEPISQPITDISSLLEDFGAFNSMPIPVTTIPPVPVKELDIPILLTPQLIPPPIVNSFDLESFQVTNDSIQICPNAATLAYSKNNIVISVSTGKIVESPAAADLRVAIVSLINLSPFGVENFTLQASASVDSKLKLFPPASESVLPFTPFQPCPVLSQNLVVQSGEADIALKLKVSFSVGGRKLSEVFAVTDLKWI